NKPTIKDNNWLFSIRSDGDNAFSWSNSSNFSSKSLDSQSICTGTSNPSLDLSNNRFKNGNVINKKSTIKILKLLNNVSVTGIVPIVSSKKCPGVAIKSGIEPDKPPCHNKNPL